MITVDGGTLGCEGVGNIRFAVAAFHGMPGDENPVPQVPGSSG